MPVFRGDAFEQKALELTAHFTDVKHAEETDTSNGKQKGLPLTSSFSKIYPSMAPSLAHPQN